MTGDFTKHFPQGPNITFFFPLPFRTVFQHSLFFMPFLLSEGLDQRCIILFKRVSAIMQLLRREKHSSRILNTPISQSSYLLYIHNQQWYVIASSL